MKKFFLTYYVHKYRVFYHLFRLDNINNDIYEFHVSLLSAYKYNNMKKRRIYIYIAQRISFRIV